MRRSVDVDELLDGPLPDHAAVAGNLRDLARINRHWGGVRASQRAIDHLAADRDPLTILDVGELDIIKDGVSTPFAVSGGFMEVLPNRVTILADTAERADQIDEARAEAARRSAEERIAQRHTDQEMALAEAELRRALIRLKIAQLKRNRK